MTLVEVDSNNQIGTYIISFFGQNGRLNFHTFFHNVKIKISCSLKSEFTLVLISEAASGVTLESPLR